jgi:hypothetical protein
MSLTKKYTFSSALKDQIKKNDHMYHLQKMELSA